MKFFNKKHHILFLILFFSSCLIVYFSSLNIKAFNNSNLLKVVFLNVGQGDAIYIETPNKTQMLIDGGYDNKVLTQLSKVMPLGDRSIDYVIATHPDADHIGGLVNIVDYYKIGKIIENGAPSETQVYQGLQKKIEENEIEKIIAQQGMKIVLQNDKNIYFDILFPTGDVLKMESNDASIVGKLVYNEKSFVLTGDATIYSEILINKKYSQNLKSDVLKLGHHGAKTSSSLLWFKNVSPEIAIISSGLNNRYNHPNPEVINRLKSLQIPYLNTAEEGNIIFETDGISLTIK